MVAILSTMENKEFRNLFSIPAPTVLDLPGVRIPTVVNIKEHTFIVIVPVDNFNVFFFFRTRQLYDVTASISFRLFLVSGCGGSLTRA